jgi:hypothetical protein
LSSYRAGVEKAKYEAYNSQRIGCYQDTFDNIAHSFEFVLEIRFTRINNIILNFFPKFPAILLIYIYLRSFRIKVIPRKLYFHLLLVFYWKLEWIDLLISLRAVFHGM